jgi:hypothetical protein
MRTNCGCNWYYTASSWRSITKYALDMSFLYENQELKYRRGSIFFYWALLAGAPGSTAAMKAYCTSLALEIPALPLPTMQETSSRERGNYG